MNENKTIYLPCTYDAWDESIQKSQQKKKKYPKYKQAKMYKNIYAR